jgi:hypothetical protein
MYGNRVIIGACPVAAATGMPASFLGCPIGRVEVLRLAVSVADAVQSWFCAHLSRSTGSVANMRR